MIFYKNQFKIHYASTSFYFYSITFLYYVPPIQKKGIDPRYPIIDHKNISFPYIVGSE